MHSSEIQTCLSTLLGQINQLLAGTPQATVAISLIDASTNFSFHLNEKRPFHAASLMKILVMVEVYKQASLGHLSLNGKIEVKNQFFSIVDNSTYRVHEDTDPHTHLLLGKRVTIEELVFRMITVSSNLATNLLMEVVDITSIKKTLTQLGLTNSTVLRGVEDLKAFEKGLNNTTSSSDMASILRQVLEGKAVSRHYDNTMIEILLRQQQNEMIPTGLPKQIPVAHKTGQISRFHHDAAIIYPEKSVPFILVILIEGVEQLGISAQLGANITRCIYNTIRV